MKKVLLALTNLVEHRKKLIRGFQDKSHPWNIENEPLCIQMVDMLSEFLSEEMQYLDSVIKFVKNPTKCKHPKKDHDRCGNVWYCMNCNSDL